jgi:hypothetical protein
MLVYCGQTTERRLTKYYGMTKAMEINVWCPHFNTFYRSRIISISKSMLKIIKLLFIQELQDRAFVCRKLSETMSKPQREVPETVNNKA